MSVPSQALTTAGNWIYYFWFWHGFVNFLITWHIIFQVAKFWTFYLSFCLSIYIDRYVCIKYLLKNAMYNFW